MKARWTPLAAALLLAAGCGNSASGSGSPGSSGGPTKPALSAAAPKSGDAKPGSAALANPEENYVAAATKIGCAGLELDSPDAFTKVRAAVLSEHGYTDDSWKAASKQYGTSKGDTIVKAMEGKCPN